MIDDKKPAAKADMKKARVLRDMWDAEGERITAGTEIEVDADTLIDGVEKGTLERVK